MKFLPRASIFIIATGVTDSFMIKQSVKRAASTKLNGRFTREELAVDESDPWYYQAWGGISQADFYPSYQAANRLIKSSPSTPPAVAAAAEDTSTAPVPPPLEAMPEESQAISIPEATAEA